MRDAGLVIGGEIRLYVQEEFSDVSAPLPSKSEGTCPRLVIQLEHMLAYMFYTAKNEIEWECGPKEGHSLWGLRADWGKGRVWRGGPTFQGREAYS